MVVGRYRGVHEAMTNAYFSEAGCLVLSFLPESFCVGLKPGGKGSGLASLGLGRERHSRSRHHYARGAEQPRGKGTHEAAIELLVFRWFPNCGLGTSILEAPVPLYFLWLFHRKHN